MENLSVRERILVFSKKQGVLKKEIAEKMGVNSSNLAPSATNSTFSSQTLVRFLVAFPEVSSEWLMRGEGPMLRRSTDGVINGDVNNHAENNSSASITLNMERQNAELLKSKDDIITAQRELIDSLRSQIRMLERSCSENYRQVNYMSEPQTTEYNKIGTTTEQNK